MCTSMLGVCVLGEGGGWLHWRFFQRPNSQLSLLFLFREGREQPCPGRLGHLARVGRALRRLLRNLKTMETMPRQKTVFF